MARKNNNSNNHQKVVLVTGGAGYKGSTLVRELLFKGYRVRVLDSLMYGGRAITPFFNHPNFDFLKGDIRKKTDVDSALDQVTDVMHLAAIVGDKPCEKDPKLSVEINYDGTQILAEAASRHGVERLIFASTCSNYGISDPSVPVSENGQLNPVSLYAELKIDCEKLLTDLARKGKICTVCLRFSTAFGVSGRTRFDLTVNSFTFEALRDKKVIVFSEESWRPFSHVLDMANIYQSMLQAPKEEIAGQIYNAGWNKQNYMKKDIINMIKEVIGDFEVDYINTIEDRRSYRVDFTKIEKLLNLQVAMPLKKGIEEVASAIKTGLLTECDFENNKLK